MGTLFVISAPSGAGKTSLVSELSKLEPSLQVSVSHTTRLKRPEEKEGLNYHFVRRSQFEGMVGAGDFLEFAEVFGHLYGTSQSWVRQELKRGKDVLLEIDWQGAAQVAKLIPCVRIFILPPSKSVLEQRLSQRAQDPPAVIQQRLAAASKELSHYGEYDYLVVNDVFEQAVFELRSIVWSQRLLTSKQVVSLAPMLKDLLA